MAGLSELSSITIYPKTSAQITLTGGLVNLNSGFTCNEGCFLAVYGSKGLIKVKLVNSDEVITLPFFVGWNPVMIKEVIGYTGNTATNVYWGM
jgi:hypothetical protein